MFQQKNTQWLMSWIQTVDTESHRVIKMMIMVTPSARSCVGLERQVTLQCVSTQL